MAHTRRHRLTGRSSLVPLPCWAPRSSGRRGLRRASSSSRGWRCTTDSGQPIVEGDMVCKRPIPAPFATKRLRLRSIYCLAVLPLGRFGQQCFSHWDCSLAFQNLVSPWLPGGCDSALGWTALPGLCSTPFFCYCPGSFGRKETRSPSAEDYPEAPHSYSWQWRLRRRIGSRRATKAWRCHRLSGRWKMLFCNASLFPSSVGLLACLSWFLAAAASLL